jgi:hypothetical protein
MVRVQGAACVVYRKGELSRATIDREWPHQLALSAEFLRGKNCIIVERFTSDAAHVSAQEEWVKNGPRGRVR